MYCRHIPALVPATASSSFLGDVSEDFKRERPVHALETWQFMTGSVPAHVKGRNSIGAQAGRPTKRPAASRNVVRFVTSSLEELFGSRYVRQQKVWGS